MLSSSTRCQGTGPQPADLPFAPKRISSLLTNSVRVASGPKWHIPFTILLLFFTTAASKEDQSFLNTVSATGWPTGNVTTIFPEKATNPGHTQWDQQQTDLSFSSLPNGVNQRKAGQPPASPPQHVDAFRERSRSSYAMLASVQSMGASLQDLVSSPGMGPLGTTEGRPLFLRSSREETSQSSGASQFFRSCSDSLSVPSSIPSRVASSRKVLLDQMTTFSEDYDTVQLVATKSPTDVTSPVTQSLSSLWLSARYPVEATARVALPTSAALRGSQSEEAPVVSTQQQMEPLSMNSSSPEPISQKLEPHEFFPPSTAVVRSHLDSEKSTAIHSDEKSVTVPPPIHSLVKLASSSPQRLAADSTLQGSQELEVSFTMPLRNASSPDASTMEAELSFDVVKNERDQLVPGTTGATPTSVAEMPRHKVSLGMTQLAFARVAVGRLKEASLSLEPQSSLLKEHTGSSTTTPSFGTSKEREVSLLNSSLVERMKPKENLSSIVEGYLGPTMSSIYGTILEDETEADGVGVGFSTRQTSGSSPLSTLLSGSAKTGLQGALQTNLLEATAHTIGDGKSLETQYYGRTRQTTAAVKEMPTSKSPLTVMETDSIRGLTKAQTEDALPKRRSGATSLSSSSPATPTSKVWQTSKELSEPETMTDFSVTKVFSLGTTKNDSAAPPRPYLDKGDVLHPVRAASTGMTNTELPEGPTISSAVESFGSPSVEQKLSSPSRSHPPVSPPELIKSDRSSVTPSHRSLFSSVASLPFSRIGVPESTMKTFIKVTEGHLVRKGQMMASSTMSLSAAPLSLESRNTVGGIALSSPAKVPRVGTSSSSGMVTLKNALGHQATGTSPANNIRTVGRTALPFRSSGFTTSRNSDVPAYPSSVLETKSNQAPPIFSTTITLWTPQRTLPAESKTTCRNFSCSASTFTPLQKRSAQSMTSSQPFFTRKFLITILGTMEPKKNGTLADAKMSRSEERYTTTLPRTKIVTGAQNGNTSQQPSSKFTNSLSNQSVKESLTLGKSNSTVPSVRVLSLWFRLLKIKYTNLLMNKSSESYKKLEKEIKLTLTKMLSTYENFLHARVLRFVNGSVIVESLVVFQATGLLPTPSDIIRTIVTQVESREIDAFFDWRIDVRSLHLNGFSLRNLEPENLAVSFTLLQLGSVSAFDDKNLLQERLDSLKIQMKLLLGTRYAVHLISLVDNRNTQGNIDINGNIFIKSDTHVDVGWMLKALVGLANISVDLISLSINGSKLSLQVFPVSFLITNRVFNEKMLDRSSVEHQNLAKDLSATLARILGKYENLLQVAIRNITGGSLVCYGDVIFQQPAPSNKDVLQTLAFSVDPKDYLDSSSFQVDRFSFTVAGVGLEPSLKKTGVPVYGVILIVVCLLAVIIVPTFLWLPKTLARRGKITVNREPDARVDVEAFELDNPGYQATLEEGETKKSCIVMENF